MKGTTNKLLQQFYFKEKNMFRNLLIDPTRMVSLSKGYDFNIIKVDIAEKEKEFVIHADMPGAQKENIQVDFSDGALTISVENKTQFKEEEGTKILKMERSYCRQSRTFSFEAPIDDEKIEAKYENGVLELRIPKKVQETQMKKITIN